MISLTPDSGRFRLYQRADPPVIYLDHWALMEIACNEASATRFRETLGRAGGTLVFSWMGLYEFSGVTDSRQTTAVDALLESLYPNSLAFVLTDPDEIVANEDRILRGGPRRAPHLDQKLCELFVARKLHIPAPLRFVSEMAEPEKAADARRKWEDASQRFARMIEKARSMPGVRRRLEIKKGEARIQSPLRYVYRAALIYVLKNTRTRLDTHHWSDFIHAVVPSSYCDILVLDRGWATATRQVLDQLSRKGLLTAHAEVFAGHALGAFWDRLEDWKPPGGG